MHDIRSHGNEGLSIPARRGCPADFPCHSCKGQESSYQAPDNPTITTVVALLGMNKRKNEPHPNQPTKKVKDGNATMGSADLPGMMHCPEPRYLDSGTLAPNVQAVESQRGSPFVTQDGTRSTPPVSATQQLATSTLQNAHDFTIGGRAQFYNIGVNNVNQFGGINGMDIVKEFVSFAALHDSSAQDPSRQCHPGTRERILKIILDWVDNIDAQERILWLHGPAGVGKSAIAQTIANTCGSENLAASFFFFRSDSSRNDGNRLFPTLAWQLMFSIPVLQDRILKALERHPDLPRKTVEIQFEGLIARPFAEAAAEISPHMPTLARLVIIDGVDECKETMLQRRFLELLGKTSRDSHTPLRFLICSRPEAQIKDVFNKFQTTTLEVDLTNLNEAYRDIEKYLKDQFALIASNQDIDSRTWPEESVINDLVIKSSGQFVYASTIIKFVSDEYSSAISQLDIVLGLKPSEGESPFAELDALYIEILQRQPHQAFLKEFLTILVMRTHIDFEDLKQDDALLLNISQIELHRKLRGMHSLLKFEPHIDVHHKSFLEFMQQTSRAVQFNITPQIATRRYLELIVEVLVRYGSPVLKEPDFHGPEHLSPAFGRLIWRAPEALGFAFEDLDRILEPLRSIRDKFLSLPNLSPPWKRGNCDQCSIFFIIDHLFLYLAFLHGISHPFNPPKPHANDEQEESDGAYPRIEKAVQVNYSESSPSTLLADLHEIAPFPSVPSEIAINLLTLLLKFDPEEIALQICSCSDAQKLIDLIFYEVYFGHLRSRPVHDAARLAFAIYARVPLLPQYLFFDRSGLSISHSDESIDYYCGKPVMLERERLKNWNLYDMLQFAFSASILSHDTFIGSRGIFSRTADTDVDFAWEHLENGTMREWRNECNPTVVEIQERLLEVAKAIRLIHSFGILLGYVVDGANVWMDAGFHCKIQAHGVFSRYINEVSKLYEDGYDEFWMFEADIKYFGLLFYEIYFNIGEPVYDLPINPPNQPAIHPDSWRLIQQCCMEDPKMRPTMSEVVAEMETWK